MVMNKTLFSYVVFGVVIPTLIVFLMLASGHFSPALSLVVLAGLIALYARKKGLRIVSLLSLAGLLPAMAFAQDGTDYESIISQVIAYIPSIGTILMYIGGAVVLGWVVDTAVDDKYDKGFMKYLFKLPVLGKILQITIKMSYKIPVIGSILAVLAKFSPTNTTDAEPK